MSQQELVNVAIPFQQSLTNLDPGKITTLSQAIILRNLFSALFEYDDSGNLRPGLAASYKWIDGKLELTFDSRPVVSNGRPITANDVRKSLFRLMKVGNRVHGNLQQLICPNAQVAINECGIETNNSKIYLKPVDQNAAKQLIPLLATVDFRILPEEAVDWENPDLPIKRYDITTGAYSVDHVEVDGSIILKSNRGFYHFSAEMPQKIRIPNTDYHRSIEDFREGKVQVLSSAIPVTQAQLDTLKDTVKTLASSQTYKLRIKLLYFSKNAIDDFSVRHRFHIASVLKKRFDKIALPEETQTVEFFQEFAAGYLNPDQRKDIEAARKENLSTTLPRKVKFGLTPMAKQRWADFFAENTEFVGIYSDKTFFQIPETDRPDVFLGANDVAFDRSSSVLSYNIRMGVFGPFGPNSESWLKKYSASASDTEQIEMINQLHFNALLNCYLFPLGASPYFIFARDGWRPNMNPYFSSTELWRLQKN